jgi:hypothetical protein
MDRERLTVELRCELDHLRQVAGRARRLIALPASDRREWDTVAAAKFVADLWLGLENLCKRRLAAIGSSMPEGGDSHARLLEDFLNVDGLGRALKPEIQARLKKYLAFRHRFIHGYGQELTWAMVEEPLRLLPETVRAISRVWESWMSSLSDA